MRKIVKPLIIFTAGIAVGSAGLFGLQNWNSRFHVGKHMSPSRDFASHALREKETMDALMKRIMDQLSQNEQDSLWAPFPGFSEDHDVAVNETDHEFVYRIPIEDLKNKKVNVDVQDGYVTVTAKTAETTAEKKGDAETGDTDEFFGLYKKTFPLVAGADPAKMDFSIEKDSVVIRFSRLKGA